MSEKGKIDVDGLLGLMLQSPFTELSIGARCLYLICVAKSASNAELEMSTRGAERYGICKRSFIHYMKELKQFGFIRLKEKGENGPIPNKYTVILDWCVSGLPTRTIAGAAKQSVKPVDANQLKEFLKNGYNLGLIQTMKDIEEAIDECSPMKIDEQWPRWIKTADRKPTEDDANEDGCVLSININPGDMNTTNWPWNMVAAFPDNLPVWMPLPKKPGLENLEGVKDGL